MTTDKLDGENNRLSRKSFQATDSDEFDDGIDYEKMKVECICPKCGKKHFINFHWIGRGTLRKFCPPCRGIKES
jgi:hypothetical protein